MEVAEQDGGLRAGDDQDNKDKEEETKHVVHLMGPGGQEETCQISKRASHRYSTYKLI